MRFMDEVVVVFYIAWLIGGLRNVNWFWWWSVLRLWRWIVRLRRPIFRLWRWIFMLRRIVYGLFTRPIFPSVFKFSSRASENLLTCPNHVLCKGKLLTVQDQEISVFLEFILASSTVFLKTLDCVSLPINLAIDSFNPRVTLLDSFEVVMDCISVHFNAALQVVNIVIDIDYSRPNRFKCNHDFSLSVNSLFVDFLVPEGLPGIEIVNCFFETRVWHMVGVVVYHVLFHRIDLVVVAV